MMRTTLNLPDDVYQAARSLAASKKLPLGEAVGEFASGDRGTDVTRTRRQEILNRLEEAARLRAGRGFR